MVRFPQDTAYTRTPNTIWRQVLGPTPRHRGIDLKRVGNLVHPLAFRSYPVSRPSRHLIMHHHLSPPRTRRTYGAAHNPLQSSCLEVAGG